MFGEKRQSLASLAECGDVEGLKAALKLDATSVNDADEVKPVVDVLHTPSKRRPAIRPIPVARDHCENATKTRKTRWINPFTADPVKALHFVILV